MPFGIAQYVQCILQGLTSVLLRVLFIFVDSEKCQLVVAHDGFFCITARVYKCTHYKLLITVATEVQFWIFTAM